VKKPSGLGARIALARNQAELSQTGLGKAFGLTRSSVSQWEGDLTEPTSANLRSIAMRCGVNYDWLATGRGTMRNGQSPELQEAIQLLGEASPEVVTAVLTLLKQGRGN
jgi:transcriptional regulator with XRE-family HTH domain